MVNLELFAFSAVASVAMAQTRNVLSSLAAKSSAQTSALQSSSRRNPMSNSDPWFGRYPSNYHSRYDDFDDADEYESGVQPRHYLDYLQKYAANYLEEKEDDSLDKTYGFLVPMLVIIGIVSLTIPVVAIMFFMFMYRNNSAGGCTLTGQSKTKSKLYAEPKLYEAVIDLMGTVEKALTSVERKFGKKAAKNVTSSAKH